VRGGKRYVYCINIASYFKYFYSNGTKRLKSDRNASLSTSTGGFALMIKNNIQIHRLMSGVRVEEDRWSGPHTLTRKESLLTQILAIIWRPKGMYESPYHRIAIACIMMKKIMTMDCPVKEVPSAMIRVTIMAPKYMQEAIQRWALNIILIWRRGPTRKNVLERIQMFPIVNESANLVGLRMTRVCLKSKITQMERNKHVKRGD
jgi:hypothetical protein